MADEDKPTDEALADDASVDESLEETIDFRDADEPSADDRLAAEKDRALRLQAELQNVLTRTSREVATERKYGAVALARDLLPVLDNVDRALEAAGDAAEGLTEGFRLVRQQLVTVLQQHHCQRIETDGLEFDPELHEAILQQPSDEHPAGVIVMTTQTGYRLHDRVVRPAQVIVSSGPAE